MIYPLLIFTVTLFSFIQPQPDANREIPLTRENFEEESSIYMPDLDGWLYRAGDNRDWSEPETNLSEWKPVSLGMFSREIPEDWNGIGWFKITFRTDSTLFGKEAGIQGRIYGAMEIYLNGELIGRAGTVGNSVETEKSIGYFEPIVFSFDDRQTQHLSIRYSNHNYKKLWNKAPIGPLISMGNVPEISSTYKNRREELILARQINILQIGFFLALGILHFSLFYFYPSERANIIYGGMMFAMSIGAYFPILLSHTYQPENFIQYVTGEGFFVTFFSILNLFFVYQITYRRLNWFPVAYSVLGLPILYVVSTNPVASRPLITLYLYASFLIAIGFFARDRFTKNRKDLNIILLVYTLYFILILPRSIVFVFISSDLDFLWAQNYLIFQLTGFLIPVGYSIYLAKDVALTNRHLKHKLQENDKLSKENLQAEKEKQLLIHRQKNNLEKEVKARTADLQKSLEELKSTQEQLIQQEKLASLGQLTAGIAHEIKNPLNFVNNFSDLSLELVEEAREELSALSSQLSEGTDSSPFEGGDEVPDGTEVGDDTSDNHNLILDILNDIEANLRKIHEHGSRADSIVKSMLQHSRGGDGKMELTDLNRLVKEYVNLAFHGMRAGKGPINVDIELDLDEEVGEVPLIAEDFSRVVLNLCNNAFDAMREKINAKDLQDLEDLGGLESYQPKLTVKTHRNDQTVTIEIQDNGPGIPDAIKDKILQPFFTTKKGKQGTGLGLSITHDIVKAHGGQISISSQPGSNCFTIKISG